MPFKLSGEQINKRREIVQELLVKWADVENTITDYNSRAEALYDEVQAAVNEYNAALEAAVSLRDYVHDTAENDIRERSDRWSESAAADDARAWVAAWEELYLDEIELDAFTPLIIDEPEHSVDLENAPEQAGAS